MSAPDTFTRPSHILIIGAGVFGLGTALSLLHRPAFKHASITILDASPTLPNPSGSSVDASRVVRADYASVAYARLAVEAQKLWRDTSPAGWGGESRYHEPGFLLTADEGRSDYVRQALATVREIAAAGIGLDPGQIEELPTKEAICKASGYQQISGDKGYLNRSSGWADAEACVKYALGRVQVEGRGRVAICRGAKVARLVYEHDAMLASRCTGVQLEDGKSIVADLTVVAAGAWSPSLIDLQGRALATGQALAYLDISEEEQRAMENRPTIMNLSQGMFIVPPRNRELKIARHGFGYRNPTRLDSDHLNNSGDSHPAPSPEVSVPAVAFTFPQKGSSPAGWHWKRFCRK